MEYRIVFKTINNKEYATPFHKLTTVEEMGKEKDFYNNKGGEKFYTDWRIEYKRA